MRTRTGFFILFFILLVSGCNSEHSAQDIYMYTDDSLPPYIENLEDIINTNGKLENKERFDEFFNSVQQGKDNRIRVVKYTIEGAPIISDYEFENEVISVTIDTRRDGYGQGNIVYTTCTSIIVNEDNEKTSYELEDCRPSIGDNIILTIE
ncbi:DUF4362 domain-containing protein [Solibacillus sp. FSL K6-1523]|uniref:DUF4362 domain-containing protein n=1 Tax=Solibacillus sp. FSL K6-1523 TaxID=2921471 RepID=UPI0030FA7CC1